MRKAESSGQQSRGNEVERREARREGGECRVQEST